MFKSIAAAIATVSVILTGVAAASATEQAQSTPSAPINPKTPAADCLVGYPDGTYKGDRALTRYEFAAGMNACLNKLNESIPKASDMTTQSEFNVILQQQQTMNEELKKLNDRVNTLPSE